ncbi:hypothetical protein ES707_09613 [subsurface metagenome]
MKTPDKDHWIVAESWACPNCKEDSGLKLVWHRHNTIYCSSCRHTYHPPAGRVRWAYRPAESCL